MYTCVSDGINMHVPVCVIRLCTLTMNSDMSVVHMGAGVLVCVWVWVGVSDEYVCFVFHVGVDLSASVYYNNSGTFPVHYARVFVNDGKVHSTSSSQVHPFGMNSVE